LPLLLWLAQLSILQHVMLCLLCSRHLLLLAHASLLQPVSLLALLALFTSQHMRCTAFAAAPLLLRLLLPSACCLPVPPGVIKQVA
jgi:hypothetical protein